MTKDKDEKCLDAIINEASKLPIEQQEYVLAVIKGMLFTRKYYTDEEEENPL